MLKHEMANYPMTLRHMRRLRIALLAIAILACRDKRDADSTRESLPPVYPSKPASSTNWDVDAGPVMLASLGAGPDTAAVILPEITDSTIASVQGSGAPVNGLTFDFFGRGGKLGGPATVTAIQSPHDNQECDAWPVANVHSGNAGWRIGFAAGHAQAIKVDSIEAMPSTDSAALAVSLAQTAATLAIASDPTFRGLRFRVQSAYTFRLDSTDVVIADIVRSVNEEANPRVEHLLLIGERPVGSAGRFNAGYYNRTAGAEETTQTSDLLAVVRLGASRKPAIIINMEYDDGRTLGLIERVSSGQWRSVWRSAFTDC